MYERKKKEQFIENLIKSFKRYFDGIIQPFPFWDFTLLLGLYQSNLSKPFGFILIYLNV